MSSEPSDWSDRRATTFHEAGHAVMSAELRVPFKYIDVTPSEERSGVVHGFVVGEWFRPDLEITRRTEQRIQSQIHVLWAGTQAQERWSRCQPDCPKDLDEELRVGAASDINTIVNLASFVTASAEELDAYIEWLRLRTLNMQNRPHYWDRVTAVAGALAIHPYLSARRARAIMRDAVAAKRPSLGVGEDGVIRLT